MHRHIKPLKNPILKVAASFLVAFLLVATPLFADVAVYSYKGTASSIGNGGMQAIKMSGYFVIDLDSGPPNEGASVGLTMVGSRVGFSEVPLSASVITPVMGPGGKTYTLIADAESPLETPTGSTAVTQLKYESAFGVNSLVQVRSGGPFKSLPKSMTSPFMVIGRDSGAYYLQRGQLTYKFEANLSQWANYNNYSLVDLISYARNIYIQAGFPEW